MSTVRQYEIHEPLRHRLTIIIKTKVKIVILQSSELRVRENLKSGILVQINELKDRIMKI